MIDKKGKILYCRNKKCQYLDPKSETLQLFFARLLLGGPDKVLVAKLETDNGIKIGLFYMYEFWDPIAEKPTHLYVMSIQKHNKPGVLIFYFVKLSPF